MTPCKKTAFSDCTKSHIPFFTISTTKIALNEIDEQVKMHKVLN